MSHIKITASFLSLLLAAGPGISAESPEGQVKLELRAIEFQGASGPSVEFQLSEGKRKAHFSFDRNYFYFDRYRIDLALYESLLTQPNLQKVDEILTPFLISSPDSVPDPNSFPIEALHRYLDQAVLGSLQTREGARISPEQ